MLWPEFLIGPSVGIYFSGSTLKSIPTPSPPKPSLSPGFQAEPGWKSSLKISAEF